MSPTSRYGHLSEVEKDALLDEQMGVIEWLHTRVKELEARLSKPKKTSSNSHQPPSSDGPGKPNRRKAKRRKRPSRPGVARALAADPDRTERHHATGCPRCAAALPIEQQQCRLRYDHIE